MTVTISETCTQENTQQSKPMDRLEPPAATIPKLKSPLHLLLQTIGFILMIIPLILYGIIEEIFFKKPKSVKGKVVLVTGSGRGLGQGFALKFAKLGCKVACVDIDENINKETVQMINDQYPGSAKGYVCNIGMSNEIRDLKAAIEKDLGDVNIVVNNAGLIAGTPITDFDDAYVHGVISINLTSHFFMIREFLPDMIKRNEGHIAAVSSIAAFEGLSKGSMYVATKHGVLGLMESLHYELDEIPNNKVQTSVICPYFVNTSAMYTKNWDIRIPELSISHVVNVAVAGIRKNRRIITVPSYFYVAFLLCKLLPDRANKLMRNIFYVRLNVPSMDFQRSTPVFKLLMKSMRNINLGYDDILKDETEQLNHL